MRILLFLLMVATACAEPKTPHAWDCVKVSSAEIKGDQFIVAYQNTCPAELPQVYVLLKFFDTEWNRIGVEVFGAYYVSSGEKILFRGPVPAHLQGRAKHVGIRKISEDSQDILR